MDVLSVVDREYRGLRRPVGGRTFTMIQITERKERERRRGKEAAGKTRPLHTVLKMMASPSSLLNFSSVTRAQTARASLSVFLLLSDER